MRADNSWYGHDSLLAGYVGRDPASPPPIWGTLYHGWTLDYNPLGRLKYLRAPLLLWNERHISQAHAQGPVHGIGAPFIYGAATYRHVIEDARSRPDGGTLFLPSHSSDGDTYEHDFAVAIKEIQTMSPAPHHVAVYYQDWSDQRCDIIRGHGCTPVTFGHRLDHLFLINFMELAATKAMVVSDSISSGVLYCGYLGLSMAIANYNPTLRSRDSSCPPTVDQREWLEVIAPGISQRPLSAEESRGVAEFELGHSMMRHPDELSHLLGWDSMLRRGLAALTQKILHAEN